jgi:multidrug efflux pump subunit AcrB
MSVQALTRLRGAPGLEDVLTTVGGAQQGATGGSGNAERAGAVRNAALIVKLAPRDQRARQVDVESIIRARLLEVAGARFHVGSGRPGETMELILSSDNAQALKATAEALQRQLRGVKGLANISTTASLERPEIIARPDLQRAADLGGITASIGDAVRIATSGDFDAGVARLNLDNRQVHIRARVSDAALTDLDTLANMRVDGKDGPVALSSVANLTISSGPSEIDRYDRHRYVTVDADLAGTPLGAALSSAKALPAVKETPSSVKLIDSGDAETQDEPAVDFGAAIVIAACRCTMRSSRLAMPVRGQL